MYAVFIENTGYPRKRHTRFYYVLSIFVVLIDNFAEKAVRMFSPERLRAFFTWAASIHQY